MNNKKWCPFVRVTEYAGLFINNRGVEMDRAEYLASEHYACIEDKCACWVKDFLPPYRESMDNDTGLPTVEPENKTGHCGLTRR